MSACKDRRGGRGYQANRATSHAGLVERGGCPRGQGGVGFGAVLQQQPHTLQAPGRAGVTQRGAPVHVPGIHLIGDGVIRWRFLLLVTSLVTALADLSSGLQQQPDTLGLAADAGLMQGRDGVHGHHVDRGSALDELLQLRGLTLRRCSVHLGSF